MMISPAEKTIKMQNFASLRPSAQRFDSCLITSVHFSVNDKVFLRFPQIPWLLYEILRLAGDSHSFQIGLVIKWFFFLLVHHTVRFPCSPFPSTLITGDRRRISLGIKNEIQIVVKNYSLYLQSFRVVFCANLIHHSILIGCVSTGKLARAAYCESRTGE